MTQATAQIETLRRLVDLALMLQGTTPETSKALTRALSEAQETVARVLAEASAALSTPPAPVLERVPVRGLRPGDCVLVSARVVEIEPLEYDGDMPVGVAFTGDESVNWLRTSDEVLRDPREVRS
jgi:hypothetical protein